MATGTYELSFDLPLTTDPQPVICGPTAVELTVQQARPFCRGDPLGMGQNGDPEVADALWIVYSQRDLPSAPHPPTRAVRPAAEISLTRPLRPSVPRSPMVALLRLLLAIACLLGAVDAKAQGLGAFVSPGELAEPHADLEGITRCTECHELGKGLSPARCLVCHEGVKAQIDELRGFHADKGSACEKCHPDHRGRAFDMIRLDEGSFDHAPTGFALEGAHAEAACKDCHTDPSTFAGLPQTCRECHEDPHGAAQATKTDLSACERCHGPTAWKALPLPPAVFDHTSAAQVRYVLAGRHVDVACLKCHPDWRFVPTASGACADCHADMHRGQFGARSCEQCHTVGRARFARRDYDHDATSWPLLGRHKVASCESCHGDGEKARYVGLPHEHCAFCHKDPHRGQFDPRDCDACHAVDVPGFALAGFDHEMTAFPLRGAHTDVACEFCHTESGEGGTFSALPHDDCLTCHEDPHEGHFAPETCASCHEDGAWEVKSFDHDRTGFALTGKHAETECAACHGTGGARVLAPLAHGTCYECHAEDDPHEGELDAGSCEGCHATAAWAEVRFDHATTDFPLEGAHAPLACSACHEAQDLRGAEAACEACHDDDRPEPHFDGTCGECHAFEGWTPATLGSTGHEVTGFPLRGAHADLACADCHLEQRVLTSPFCITCHASDDPHRNLLTDACSDCHVETDWMRTRFRHGATGFPLRGSHRVAACVDCHATGFAGTPRDCQRCHEHEAPGDALHGDPFTEDCEMCHKPYDWEESSYPHGGWP